ncbi:putative secreted protein [Salmonella enterica subsp. enterica]|nr:putative secreted protein [Salmonella enterica subsp. enterica]
MNKSMLAGIGIGVAAALGVAAVASLNVFDRGPQYAQVISAKPIKETVKTPRQECRNVTVTHRRPVQDENRIAGSVLGAVAGGVIGHQFGGGRGKDVATVVGRWAAVMLAIKSRGQCRKVILTLPRSNAVRRCMTNLKRCLATT